MPIKIVAKKKNTKKSGVDGVAKTKDMQAIKAKKDLKYKQNHSFGEHYNKEFQKTFNNPLPAKVTKNPTSNKIAAVVGKALSPTIAMKAALNNKNNKQYKTNRSNKTETLGNTKNPFKKVEKNFESRPGYKSAGGKMSKYYSKGGTVFTGR